MAATRTTPSSRTARCGQRLAGLGQRVQHAPRQRQQVAAGPGDAQAARMAVEQADVHQPLQVGQALRHRRLAEPQRLGTAHAGQFAQAQQHLQVTKARLGLQAVQQHGGRQGV
jgi:hypothetical protein